RRVGRCLEAGVGAKGAAGLLDVRGIGDAREIRPGESGLAEHLAELADLAGVGGGDQKVHESRAASYFTPLSRPVRELPPVLPEFGESARTASGEGGGADGAGVTPNCEACWAGISTRNDALGTILPLACVPSGTPFTKC